MSYKGAADNKLGKDNWVYDGKTKSEWAKLKTKFRELLVKERIEYILLPAEVNRRTTAPVPPNIPIVPNHETANNKNQREMQQKILLSEFEDNAKEHRKNQRKYGEDLRLAEQLLLSCLSPDIKREISQFMESQVYTAILNARDAYESVWSRLHIRYGPYYPTQVEELKLILNTLEADKLGWRESYRIFSETVDTLNGIPKRDALGNIIVQDDMQLNWRPEEYALKTYMQKILKGTKNKMFKDIWLDTVKPENLAMTYHDICVRVEAYLLYEEETDPKGSASRTKVAYRTSISDKKGDKKNNKKDVKESTSKSKADNKKGEKPATYKCNNCGKDHPRGTRCDSTKCGTCGKNFNDVIERVTHYRLECRLKNEEIPIQKKRKDYSSKNQKDSKNSSYKKARTLSASKGGGEESEGSNRS